MKISVSIVIVILLSVILAVLPVTMLGQDKEPTVKCQLHALCLMWPYPPMGNGMYILTWNLWPNPTCPHPFIMYQYAILHNGEKVAGTPIGIWDGTLPGQYTGSAPATGGKITFNLEALCLNCCAHESWSCTWITE